jgi:hypothetical protein
VTGPIGVALIVVSLALALWYLILAALNRAPGRGALAGVGALALVTLALVVSHIVDLTGGKGPADPVTLIGYLITTVAIPPAAFQLARMEPTRWGSVILTVACLTMPVLVLRLEQLARM